MSEQELREQRQDLIERHRLAREAIQAYANAVDNADKLVLRDCDGCMSFGCEECHGTGHKPATRVYLVMKRYTSNEES